MSVRVTPARLAKRRDRAVAVLLPGSSGPCCRPEGLFSPHRSLRLTQSPSIRPALPGELLLSHGPYRSPDRGHCSHTNVRPHTREAVCFPKSCHYLPWLGIESVLLCEMLDHNPGLHPCFLGLSTHDGIGMASAPKPRLRPMDLPSELACAGCSKTRPPSTRPPFPLTAIWLRGLFL